MRIVESTEEIRKPIVEFLEHELELAKAGETIAFAVVRVDRARNVLTASRNPSGNRHLLVAGSLYLTQDLCKSDE